MMKRWIGFWFGILICATIFAQTQVVISDPQTWVRSDLSAYVGKTVAFSCPFYVCNNYSGLKIAPRRVFSATNQAVPLSEEYRSVLSLNSYATVTLTGCSGSHRLGERLEHLVVKVNSTSSVQFVSGTWVGNTRADLSKGYDKDVIDFRAQHNILVCAMNLEYYLTSDFGQGYGPRSAAEHTKQRAKIRAALGIINADIYGLVEVQQGQDALAEIASDLTTQTGRHFTYINDGGSVSGTYTKSGYVYCSDAVTPIGNMKDNDSQVRNRKKMQAFRCKANGEVFTFSINHFKAKTGTGTGDDANKGDGQGSFNGTRVREAQSVLNQIPTATAYYGDPDVLVMGDLNAYGKEDPITTLTSGGLVDLHRYFHADSSYSYVYHGEAGYLDHALCNTSLLPQVTGMVAYHINSDEDDSYTYSSSSDVTMFRSSDHDPVLVGLRLDSTLTYNPQVTVNSYEVRYLGHTPCILHAPGGYYRVYTTQGWLYTQGAIQGDEHCITGLTQGIYLLHIFGQGQCLQTKLIIP